MPRKKVEVVDETKNIALALKELCEDKGLPTSVVIDAMSEALKKAYFKFSDDYPDTIIKVDIDLDTGNIQMSKIKNVVEEIQDDVFETDPEEAYEETGIHYNVGDVLETPIDITNFRTVTGFDLDGYDTSNEGIFNQFMYPIITNHMYNIGKGYTGLQSEIDANLNNLTYEIDYLRLYQKNDGKSEINLK